MQFQFQFHPHLHKALAFETSRLFCWKERKSHHRERRDLRAGFHNFIKMTFSSLTPRRAGPIFRDYISTPFPPDGMAWHGMACSREHSRALARPRPVRRQDTCHPGLDSAFGETCTRTHRTEVMLYAYTHHNHAPTSTLSRCLLRSCRVESMYHADYRNSTTTTTSPCRLIPSASHPSASTFSCQHREEKISVSMKSPLHLNPLFPFPSPTFSYPLVPPRQ